MASNTLDPVTQKQEDNNVTPQQKIKDLHKLVHEAGTGMLTTRAADGAMHARAMQPAGPHDDTQLKLIFIANNASDKFDEIQHDQHVNVSFYSPSSTSWASYAGKAHVSQDRELIKKHWSKAISAWFGDLKDGKHKGDENDPRVSVIEVIPDTIRYFIATEGKVARAAGIATAAVTGGTASPGELRTITKDEIQLTEGLHKK